MVSLRGSLLGRAGLLVLLCALAPTGCRQLVGYGTAPSDLGRPDVGAVGGVGLPCYANQTCNAGLLCSAGRCFVPDLALADQRRDRAADSQAQDAATDAGPTFQPSSCDAQVALPSAGAVSTLVGLAGKGGEDGPLASASLRTPLGLAMHANGVLVADRDNHRIRQLGCGAVWTFAGSGIADYQNGPVESARFDAPSALVVSADGTVFVADTGNRRIRRIADKKVSTYAGSGASGNSNGERLQASFVSPRGLAWHEGTATLYVADFGAGRIRAITADKVTTPVSNLKGPLGLAWADATTLLVSESDAHRLGKLDLTTNTYELYAGDGTAGLLDGGAAAARFRQPAGLLVTSDGRLWIADFGNHALRMIFGDQVSTIIGAGGGVGNDDGPLATARLNAPYALLARSTAIMILDSAAHRLRVLSP